MHFAHSGVRSAFSLHIHHIYNGTYVEDWQYVANSGSLDQCNGGMLNGKYVYFATKTYPFFPRCMWGAVSSDFTRGRPHGAKSEKLALNRKHPGLRPANGRQPPREAVSACQSVKNDSQCSFSASNGRQVRGLCLTTPANVVACVPRR
ncbi:MAG: YHYH protein [Hyphomicrobiales bacterium]|nr:YHYH protein [Hyphomicrobiales bacterium]